MKHYIYIKGREIKHTLVGRYQGDVIECLAIVNDFTYGRIKCGNDVHFGGSNEPIVMDGDYTLFSKHIIVEEWHDMTATEKRKYNKVLKDNNLCFKTFVTKGIAPLTRTEYTKESECLCWKDIEKMPLDVNGKIMPYSDFKKMTFSKDDKVVNSWDNGYSNWGEKTSEIDAIFKHLEMVASPHTEDGNDRINTTWRGGRVHCGEMWGWNHDGHGVLKIRITQKDINWSVVSNS